MASNHGTAWWCEACRRHIKYASSYCPTCGVHWSQAGTGSYTHATGHSWEEPPWKERAPSPRARQRPWSPRARPQMKGGGKDQGKRDGKGRGKSGTSHQAPSLRDLPKPVTQRTVAMPKSGVGQQQIPSEERKLLGALLAHVGDKEDLPRSLKTMMAQYREDNTQVEGKLLHQMVARQTEAKRELAKLRKVQMAYEHSWAQYIVQLVKLFEKQLEERQEVQKQFQEAESAWVQQLTEASALLSKNAGVADGTHKSDAIMEVEDSEVSEAAAEDSRWQMHREHLEQQQTDLLSAMLKAREAAEAHLVDKVERDRTPRRGGRKNTEPTLVESSPELGPR